jgi:hypothetical protein
LLASLTPVRCRLSASLLLLLQLKGIDALLKYIIVVGHLLVRRLGRPAQVRVRLLVVDELRHRGYLVVVRVAPHLPHVAFVLSLLVGEPLLLVVVLQSLMIVNITIREAKLIVRLEGESLEARVGVDN